MKDYFNILKTSLEGYPSETEGLDDLQARLTVIQDLYDQLPKESFQWPGVMPVADRYYELYLYLLDTRYEELAQLINPFLDKFSEFTAKNEVNRAEESVRTVDGVNVRVASSLIEKVVQKFSKPESGSLHDEEHHVAYELLLKQKFKFLEKYCNDKKEVTITELAKAGKVLTMLDNTVKGETVTADQLINALFHLPGNEEIAKIDELIEEITEEKKFNIVLIKHLKAVAKNDPTKCIAIDNRYGGIDYNQMLAQLMESSASLAKFHNEKVQILHQGILNKLEAKQEEIIGIVKDVIEQTTVWTDLVIAIIPDEITNEQIKTLVDSSQFIEDSLKTIRAIKSSLLKSLAALGEDEISEEIKALDTACKETIEKLENLKGSVDLKLQGINPQEVDSVDKNLKMHNLLNDLALRPGHKVILEKGGLLVKARDKGKISSQRTGGKSEKTVDAFDAVLTVIENGFNVGKPDVALLHMLVSSEWGQNILFYAGDKKINPHHGFRQKVASLYAQDRDQKVSEFREFSREILITTLNEIVGEKILDTKEYSYYHHKLSNYVEEEILKYDDVKQRSLALEQMIKVMDKAAATGDFMSAYVIYFALRSTNISRLHNTWSGISRAAQEKYEKAVTELAPNSIVKSMEKSLAAGEIIIPDLSTHKTILDRIKEAKRGDGASLKDGVEDGIYKELQEFRDALVAEKGKNTEVSEDGVKISALKIKVLSLPDFAMHEKACRDKSDRLRKNETENASDVLDLLRDHDSKKDSLNKDRTRNILQKDVNKREIEASLDDFVFVDESSSKRPRPASLSSGESELATHDFSSPGEGGGAKVVTHEDEPTKKDDKKGALVSPGEGGGVKAKSAEDEELKSLKDAEKLPLGVVTASDLNAGKDSTSSSSPPKSSSVGKENKVSEDSSLDRDVSDTLEDCAKTLSRLKGGSTDYVSKAYQRPFDLPEGVKSDKSGQLITRNIGHSFKDDGNYEVESGYQYSKEGSQLNYAPSKFPKNNDDNEHEALLVRQMIYHYAKLQEKGHLALPNLKGDPALVAYGEMICQAMRMKYQIDGIDGLVTRQTPISSV